MVEQSRGRRWAMAAFAVSLLLHLCVLGLHRFLREKPATSARKPVSITLLEPPPKQGRESPPPEPSRPRPIERRPPPPAPPTDEPSAEPSKEDPDAIEGQTTPNVPSAPDAVVSELEESSPGSGRSAPNLFPDAAIQEGARRVEGAAGEEDNPVQRMLDGVRFGRRHGPRKSSSAVALSDRMLGHFTPPGDVVRYSGELERKGFARELKRYLKSAPRDDLAINEELLDPFARTSFNGSNVSWLCITGCTSSHVVGKLSVLVEVRHVDGLPEKRGVVLVSSGYTAFDLAALDAVQTTVELASQEETRFAPNVRVTHWVFEAEIFRYRRDELLLDPQFEPPGRVIDDSLGAVYSMVTYVRFAAIKEEPETLP